MYIPAPVLRTLKTPEAVAFEQQRRRLKAAVSEARQAVTNCTAPFKHHQVLSTAHMNMYVRHKASKTGQAWLIGQANVCLPPMSDFAPLKLSDRAEEAERRYQLTLTYQTALAEHPARKAALRQAEAEARQAYADHLDADKRSDLE